MNKRDSLWTWHFCIAISVLIIISNSCIGQDCKNIPTSFSSYEQAIRLVKSSAFKVKETVDTSRSSWIRGATYYSCDSRTGFLIIKTDDREYIHQAVPIEVWRGFKNAQSFGSYYSNNIKGNYSLVLD